MANYALSVKSKYFTGKLYGRMNDDLHLAGMSQRTVHGYLRSVRQLADFCQTTPDKVTEAQLRRFFLHLKNERHFAYGSLRVSFSGIKFFYTRTCKRNWETLATMKLQNAKTLPEVLTVAQVHRIIDSVRVERIAVYFWTVYSMGLRLDEARHLQVGDIDAERGLVHIHRGKGAKDRYVPLPSSTLHWLRNHWISHRHPRLLFPAEGRNHQQSRTSKTPIQTSTVQKAMKDIVDKQPVQASEGEATPKRSSKTHPGFLNRGLGHRLVPRDVKALMVRRLISHFQISHHRTSIRSSALWTDGMANFR